MHRQKLFLRLFNQSRLQQEQEQEPRRPPNIFLVDDEEDILYTFKKGLSSEGYNVEAFSDSMEALRHFAKVNPSHYKLAVLDIRMPGLNGLQLYYRLKTINRNIKILDSFPSNGSISLLLSTFLWSVIGILKAMELM